MTFAHVYHRLLSQGKVNFCKNVKSHLKKHILLKKFQRFSEFQYDLKEAMV